MTRATRTLCMAAVVLLAACSSGPPPADWQVEAKGAMDRAVAAYLRGQLQPQDAALLPEAQRGAAAGHAAAVLALADPLSQQVAAGVWVQNGQLTAAVADAAVSAASSQGWRRPLLAWLKLQAEGAAQRGNADEAARLQRRIALVEGSVNNAAQPAAKRASAP